MPDRVFLLRNREKIGGRSDPRLIGLRSSGGAHLAGASSLQGGGEARQTSSAILFREVLVITNNKVIIQDIGQLVKRKIESIPLGIIENPKQREKSFASDQ